MKNLLFFVFLLTGTAHAQLNLIEPSPFVLCDENEDNTEIFDLTLKNADVLGSYDPALYSVAYFENESDANANVNQLNPLYASSTPTATVFPRVSENANPANFEITILMLIVQPLPTATVEGSEVCLGENPTFLLTGGGGIEPYIFEYSINGGPVQMITTPVGIPIAVIQLPGNQPQTYNLQLISVSESSYSCKRYTSLSAEAVVNAGLAATFAPDLIKYQDPFIGTAEFDLTEQDALLSSGQPDVFVQYFATLADATNGTNAYVNPSSHSNPINPETIYARVQNTLTGCFYTTSFNLIVSPEISDVVFIPDSNFKAKLLEADPANNIAYGTSGYITIDANGDNEIQFTEALAVTKLTVGASSVYSFAGLESFTNLTEFESVNNPVSSIGLSALVNLTSLKLINDQLLSLDLTAQSALTYLDVQGNNINYLNIPNSPGITYLSAGGNELSSIDVSGFANLQTLIVNDNNLGALDLQQNPDLIYLRCTGNNLFELDLANLTDLTYLACSDNHIGALDFTSAQNLTTLLCDQNAISSLNLTPLSSLMEFNCDSNNLTELDITPLVNVESVRCKGNQLTSINAAGLSNLTYLDCSQNDLVSIAVAGLDNLQVLQCSYNTLTALDLAGCINLLHVDCSGNQLTEVDLSALDKLELFNGAFNYFVELDFSNNPLTLSYTCDEVEYSGPFAITGNYDLKFLNLKNGTQFSTLSGLDIAIGVPSLMFVCMDEEDIPQLQLYVAPSANVNTYCSFVPGGDYNTITGTIGLDQDGNGCDASDTVAPYIKINYTNGSETGWIFTSSVSTYDIYTGSGDFTLTPDFENDYFITAPVSATVNFPVVDNSVVTRDFCLVPNGVHPDLEVVIAPIVPARPGFDAVYQISYKNKGNQVHSGDVVFTYNDALMDLIETVPPASSSGAGILNFHYDGLEPFESRVITITMNINAPTETPAVNINDVLAFSSVITLDGTDELPLDNSFVFNQVVIGSYDPNDKHCVEGEIVATERIGEYLHYIINFENTGTDFAQNIVIRDIIDESQYDRETLQVVSSSHPSDIRMTGNVAEVFFKNIYLPIGGHGNILLKIRSLTSLTEGATVSNKANIFFDYNFPIETNVANTTFQSLAVNDNDLGNSIAIYPNPTEGIVNIRALEEITSVQIYDVQGRLLQTQLANDLETAVDMSNYSNGIYILKVRAGMKIKVRQVIKE